jgi:superfamily II DNA or RNA helicase
MQTITILVDSRLRIALESVPESLAAAIRAGFTHTNPAFLLKKKLGIPSWGEPPVYRTWAHEEMGGVTYLTLPRGGMSRLRTFLGAYERVVQDRRTTGKVVNAGVIPASLVTLRGYQENAIRAMIAKENCLTSAPTGCGKTTMAIALASRLGLYTNIILWSGNLYDQWLERVERELGIPSKDIGQIRGKVRKIRPVTISMQQTIAAQGVDDELANTFGCIIMDEVQRAAAKTVFAAVDPFPAKYRFGISADETRKDRKEFLTYDLFGPVAYNIARDTLVEEGSVLEVEIRVVPTEFKADWYQENRDFNALLEAMIADKDRAELVASVTHEATAGKTEQILVLSHRREHCTELNQRLNQDGYRSGLMIGGADYAEEFGVTRTGLESGAILCGVGTIQAIAQGLDIPRIGRMVVVTPLAANKQLWNQGRGRVCRPDKSSGKTDAALYYLWDRCVYGLKHLENLAAWNKKVVVKEGENWVPVREYLKTAKSPKAGVEELDFDF